MTSCKPSDLTKEERRYCAISSLTRRIVQHSRFVALSRLKLYATNIDRGYGASTCIRKYNEEREHGHNSHPCEPHIFYSYGKTCYGPIESIGQHSFMEEVSILTLFFVLHHYIFILYFLYLYRYLIVCCFAVVLSQQHTLYTYGCISS